VLYIQIVSTCRRGSDWACCWSGTSVTVLVGIRIMRATTRVVGPPTCRFKAGEGLLFGPLVVLLSAHVPDVFGTVLDAGLRHVIRL